MDLSFRAFTSGSIEDETPVEVQWLRYVDVVRQIMADFAADGGHTDSQTRVIFAEHFVAHFLGDQWLENHFGSYKGSTAEEHAQFKYMIWRLGRLLFDLQSFDWFDGLVDNLRQRDLAGALFEAEVARLLMQVPVKAALRVPTGETGEDFDIDLGGAGLTVAVEVKAKDADTPFTRRTVKNTLDRARKQLPKGGVGLVFMRIPRSWVTGQTLQELESEVVRSLRNTSRVQAVILVWDELASRTGTTMRFESRQRVIPRDDIHDEVARLLGFLQQAWLSEWDAIGPASAL